MRSAVTERFKVRTESGAVLDIRCVQTSQKVQTLGSTDEIEGLATYEVVGGGHANRLSDGSFKIVATGEIATRLRS